MNRNDLIRMAREAGMRPNMVEALLPELERFAAAAFAAGAAAECEVFPDLMPVINWLENGCDPKEAAKELRLYVTAMHARRKQ